MGWSQHGHSRSWFLSVCERGGVHVKVSRNENQQLFDVAALLWQYTVMISVQKKSGPQPDTCFFNLGDTGYCLWTLRLSQPEVSVRNINRKKTEKAVSIQQSVSAPLPACTSEASPITKAEVAKAGNWCSWGGR